MRLAVFPSCGARCSLFVGSYDSTVAPKEGDCPVASRRVALFAGATGALLRASRMALSASGPERTRAQLEPG